MLDEIRRREEVIVNEAIIKFTQRMKTMLQNTAGLEGFEHFDLSQELEELLHRHKGCALDRRCKKILAEIVDKLYEEMTCENNGNQNTDGAQDAEENAE